jgi:hypothetical protein
VPVPLLYAPELILASPRTIRQLNPLTNYAMPTRPDGDILPRLSDSCPRSAETTTVTPTTLVRWLPARCRARYHHVVRILSDTPLSGNGRQSRYVLSTGECYRQASEHQATPGSPDCRLPDHIISRYWRTSASISSKCLCKNPWMGRWLGQWKSPLGVVVAGMRLILPRPSFSRCGRSPPLTSNAR